MAGEQWPTVTSHSKPLEGSVIDLHQEGAVCVGGCLGSISSGVCPEYGAPWQLRTQVTLIF